MKDLSELLERVKAATGPDRELDGAIEVQARRFEAYRVGLNDATRARWKHSAGDVYDGHTVYDSAEVTASVDAALGLVERCLPGCWWVLAKGRVTDTEPLFACELLRECSHDDRLAIAEGRTLPLAILSALLQALGEAT